MAFLEIRSDKPRICGSILRALPQWFGIEDAIERYAAESASLPMIGCRADGEVVAFLTLKVHTRFAAEIHVIAVLPDWHRLGIGRELVTRALAYAKAKDIRFLTVKTLSPKREDRHYAKTRQFYAAMGFVPIEEFDTLWGPANPVLMMIRPVEA